MAESGSRKQWISSNLTSALEQSRHSGPNLRVPRNFELETSALPPEPAVELEYEQRAASDPKRPFCLKLILVLHLMLGELMCRNLNTLPF